MKDIIKKDITDKGNCQDRVKEDEAERKDEINAATDPNWTRSRAQWVRAMDKQPGVREGHVVEYSGGCESSNY